MSFKNHNGVSTNKYFYPIKFKNMDQQQEIRKDAIVNLRLTSEEERAAFQVAKQEGKTVSEIVRDLLKNVKATNQA